MCSLLSTCRYLITGEFLEPLVRVTFPWELQCPKDLLSDCMLLAAG